MFETLKIVLPSRRELDFYKIAFFEFGGETHQQIIKKSMDFEMQSWDISLTSCLENACFFRVRFFINLEWILEGVWEVLGRLGGGKRVWKLAQMAIQAEIRFFSSSGRVLKELWGGLWEGFGRVLEGFGWVFGGSGGILDAWGPMSGRRASEASPAWHAFSIFGLHFAAFCCVGLLFVAFVCIFWLFLYFWLHLIAFTDFAAWAGSCILTQLSYMIALPVPC